MEEEGEEEVEVEGVLVVEREEVLSWSVREVSLSTSTAGLSVVTSGLTGLGSSRENSVESPGLSLGRSEG